MKSNNVSSFLENAISNSDKTQRQISNEAGFPKPNMLSMLKSGQSKIPIARIPALAAACNVDAFEFLSLALEEYEPEMWKVIKPYLRV